MSNIGMGAGPSGEPYFTATERIEAELRQEFAQLDEQKRQADAHRASGGVNAYDCRECGKTCWTIDRDAGVTPASMRCRAPGGCGEGTSFSRWYTVPADHPPPTHEWFRPSREFARREERRAPGCWQHYVGGGLWIRPIASRPSKRRARR